MISGRMMETPSRQAVLDALERFRAAREGDGGLVRRAGAEPLTSRRREDLVEQAVERTRLTRAYAELIYDIAADEDLEPAFAFELVRSGVAVCEPPRGGVPPRGTQVEGAPEWIAPAAVSEPLPTEELVRERRMRSSFRRLRGHLERCPTPEEAIDAFCGEPDVGDCGYLID